MDYAALLAEIQANPACAPHIHTNEMEPISGAAVLVKDREIAAIISAGRVRVVSHMITERGVLEVLGAAAGDTFLAALEAIKAADNLPAALQSYFGAIHRGVAWLKTDGLDVGSQTVRVLLDGLAAFSIVDGASVAKLKSLAEVSDPVTAADVSRAIRGPWS